MTNKKHDGACRSGARQGDFFRRASGEAVIESDACTSCNPLPLIGLQQPDR